MKARGDGLIRAPGHESLWSPARRLTRGPLDVFLTARFRLYSFVLGSLICAKVDHPPWPLRSARLVEAHQTLADAAGLSHPLQADMVRYSPGVDVRIAAPEPV